MNALEFIFEIFFRFCCPELVVLEVCSNTVEYTCNTCFIIIDTGKTSYSSLNQSDGSIECSNNQNQTGTEKQYLVKWTGWSHLHNTWETGKMKYICHVTVM